MKSFSIKIQSISDIITNSSSEIFCNANNIHTFKEFITGILQVIDKDAKCDDYFNVTTGLRVTDLIEEIRDNLDTDWMQKFLENNKISSEHLMLALEFSVNDEENLLPVETYLNSVGYTYNEFCNKLRDRLEDDNEGLHSDYFLIQKREINPVLIKHLNDILHNFPTRLYNITERYC